MLSIQSMISEFQDTPRVPPLANGMIGHSKLCGESIHTWVGFRYYKTQLSQPPSTPL